MSTQDNSSEQIQLFDVLPAPISVSQFASPNGYKGLWAFHKYWGKKPVECIAFLTELLTSPGEIVLDPFMGSGLLAREAAIRRRRFVGIDINPIAVEMTCLQLALPDPIMLLTSLKRLYANCYDRIANTYRVQDHRVATHYLWRGERLETVWIAKGKGAPREEFQPTPHDNSLVEQYRTYELRNARPLHLFRNSRINATEELSWRDLFTGRALHNIDILLEAIQHEPKELQRPLLLSLTSSSGQMSRMVFAITGRGKTTGIAPSRIEVGSWVVGYWRPTLHFEVNVWRCFERRVRFLAKAISDIDSGRTFRYTRDLSTFRSRADSILLLRDDCRGALDHFPESSVSLILTDPPHSDRIPYLEMSEMWNALLSLDTSYKNEIVVSNARERSKTKEVYLKEMNQFLESAVRVLQPGRFLAVMYNASDEQSWAFLSQCASNSRPIAFVGCFPMQYSANSVVQDNRSGSLKSDYVLLFQKKGNCPKEISISVCQRMPGWSVDLPQSLSGKKGVDLLD